MAGGQVRAAVGQQAALEALTYVGALGLAVTVLSYVGPKIAKLISGRDKQPKLVAFDLAALDQLIDEAWSQRGKRRPPHSGWGVLNPALELGKLRSGPQQMPATLPAMQQLRAWETSIQAVNSAFADFLAAGEQSKVARAEQLVGALSAHLREGWPISNALADELGLAKDEAMYQRKTTAPWWLQQGKEQQLPAPRAPQADPHSEAVKYTTMPISAVPTRNTTVVPSIAQQSLDVFDQLGAVPVALDDQLDMFASGIVSNFAGTSPAGGAVVDAAPEKPPTSGAAFLLLIPALYLLL